MGFGWKEQVARARQGRDVRQRMVVAALALAFMAWGAGASARGEVEQRIDLNRASVEELMSLPGVGATKAQAIVEHRRTAPFRKVEELLQVKGIGDSIYAGLRDRITVSGETSPEGSGDPGSPRNAAPGVQD